MIQNIKIYNIVKNPTLKKITITTAITSFLVIASRYSNHPIPTIHSNNIETELGYYVKISDVTYNKAILVPLNEVYYIEIGEKNYIGYDDEIKEGQKAKLGKEPTELTKTIEDIMKTVENEYRNGIFDLETNELLIRKNELVSYKWCHLEEKLNAEQLKQVENQVLDYNEIINILENENKNLVKK